MFDGRLAEDNFGLTYGSVFKLTRTHYQHSDKVIDSQENCWQYLGDFGLEVAKLKNYAQNIFFLTYGSVFKLTRTHYQHSDKVIDSQENRWQDLGDLGWKLYLIWLQAKLKNYAQNNFVLTYGSVFKLTRTHYQQSDKVIDSQENRWQYLGDLGWKLYLIWLQAKLKNYAQNNFVLTYGSVFKLTRTHYQQSDKVIDSQENRWQYLGDLGWKLYLIWLQAKLKNYAQNNFVLTYGSVFKLTRTHYQHSDKAMDSQENCWQDLGDLGWKLYLIWLQANFGPLPLSSALPLAFF
ncbi:hypothetical protein C8R44DRAFT_733010 [Mycena epipterygia]|nr:hypothetical protein C8R44DRAFT_733010 [Mycena epipterygia]